jgi:hypothetical protein
VLEAELPFPSLVDLARTVAAVTNPFSMFRLSTVELLSACAAEEEILPEVLLTTNPVDRTVKTPGIASCTLTLAT